MNIKNIEGPSFLGIGAPRSGTTWIARVLDAHPDIWIPRRKELHYFTRNDKYPSPSYLCDDSFLRRILGLESRNIEFKKKLFSSIGGCLLQRDFDRFKWELRYFVSTNNDQAYIKLFDNVDACCGEITPAYSLLDESGVINLFRLLPNIKVIYVIRNPIDRAWSTIKYHNKRGKLKLATKNIGEIKSYLSQAGLLKRSAYAEVIDLWKKYAKNDHFLLLFYDDIVSDPEKIAKELYDFVGVKMDQSEQTTLLNMKINSSSDQSMPQDIKEFLVEMYSDQISKLAEKYGGSCSNWLAY